MSKNVFRVFMTNEQNYRNSNAKTWKSVINFMEILKITTKSEIKSKIHKKETNWNQLNDYNIIIN